MAPDRRALFEAAYGALMIRNAPAQPARTPFVTEALTGMLNLAFGHFRIHRVFVRCDGRNHHSAKLMQKLGMLREGVLRDAELDRDSPGAFCHRCSLQRRPDKPWPLRGDERRERRRHGSCDR